MALMGVHWPTLGYHDTLTRLLRRELPRFSDYESLALCCRGSQSRSYLPQMEKSWRMSVAVPNLLRIYRGRRRLISRPSWTPDY